jgi:hypothetical protein
MLSEFFRRVVGVEPRVVTEAGENWECGDLLFPSGAYAECKGQPIDPERYPLNFVEVCEVTDNPRHADGMDRLAACLGVDYWELADADVWDDRAGHKELLPFGEPRMVSPSFHTISSARVTAYVNATSPTAHIYLYGRNEIVGLVREAVVRGDGMVRGAGRSNEDTFGVKIPLPAMRWTSREGGGWEYAGLRGGQWAVDKLLSVLNDEQEHGHQD